jgi:four helix bundle protein
MTDEPNAPGRVAALKPINADVMRQRTKAFGLRVIRLVESLPKQSTAQTLGKQLLRSGTSVGANYRSACRSRSRREFIAKLGIVEEECDESIFWMELIVESGFVQESLMRNLIAEAREILAIVVASIRTTRRRERQARSNRESR